MRFRNLYILIGCAVTFLMLFMIDPDAGFIQNLPFGSTVVESTIYLLRGIFGPVLLYVTRKAMHDYPEADFQLLGKAALGGNIAAAVYALAVGMMTLAYAVVIAVAVIAR